MGCGASNSLPYASPSPFLGNKQRVQNKKKTPKDEALGNLVLLETLFKQLDSSGCIIRTTGTCGEIQLALRYYDDRELLIVKLIQCKGLEVKDVRSNSSDPYVCFAVLPAPGMDNQQRSRTVMKSLNPLYNEMFTFSVSNGRLPQSQLHCSVWDYDRITTDDFIGQVCLNLCEVDWTDREPHWYDLTDKVICSLFGYVDVTVEFNLPHFLLVTVHCIRDLHIVETAAPSSLKPYVVCSVTGLNQTHRTPAYEVSNCIVVDESFEFSMAKEELLGRYVVVSVSDAQNISKSQWQGQCVIALSEVVPHEPVKDSYELGTPREYHDIHMTSAQQSALANEFQQALVAHAAFRQPSWLFEKKKSRRKDKGNRMLAVTSKRGGQQSALTAALTLQNGQVDSI